MLKNIFQKIPVTILIFLMFTLTSAGIFGVLKSRNESSQRIFDFGFDSEELESLNGISDDNLDDSLSSPVKNNSIYEDDDKYDDDSEDDSEDDDGDEEDEDNDDDSDNLNNIKTSKTPTPIPAPAPTPTPATSKSFTMLQVSTHNSSASCYSVVNGNVYDLTSWIGKHPGGKSAISSMCGLDASAEFNGQHGGQPRPVSELAGFKIGVLIK